MKLIKIERVEKPLTEIFFKGKSRFSQIYVELEFDGQYFKGFLEV